MSKPTKIKAKYHYLTPIIETERYILPCGDTKRQYLCRCKCGKEITVFVSNLASGNTKSCGCYIAERAAEVHTKHGYAGKTKIYRIWRNINSRINTVNGSSYHYYGGRGIKICKRWRDFKNFLRDMEPSFNAHYAEHGEDTSIERVNVDGDYKPSNCKWATKKEQLNNTRRSKSYKSKNKQ